MAPPSEAGSKRKTIGRASKAQPAKSAGPEHKEAVERYICRFVSSKRENGKAFTSYAAFIIAVNAHCKKYQGPGYLKCLRDQDWTAIWEECNRQSSIEVEHQAEEHQGHASHQHGIITPTETPDISNSGKEKQAQEQADVVSAESADEGPREPMTDETGGVRTIVLFCGQDQHQKRVTVRHYQCRESLISREIIKRHNLIADNPRSIRLDWRETNVANGGSKTKSTRFEIVDDEDIDSDVAFGTDYRALDAVDETSSNDANNDEDGGSDGDLEECSAADSDEIARDEAVGTESSGDDNDAPAASTSEKRSLSKRLRSISQSQSNLAYDRKYKQTIVELNMHAAKSLTDKEFARPSRVAAIKKIPRERDNHDSGYSDGSFSVQDTNPSTPDSRTTYPRHSVIMPATQRNRKKKRDSAVEE